MPFEMQKDIMYFRLSEEDEEDKRESNSISSQRACVEQYLHDRPELGSNFEEIVDDGYSGTSLDRPGMRRLLAMNKKKPGKNGHRSRPITFCKKLSGSRLLS